jgi:hypothetical protein
VINNKYFLILTCFIGVNTMHAMDRPGTVTRARAQQQRTSRDRVLSEVRLPVNEWSEESKQHYFTNYWHGLLHLKSNYVKEAELSGHRCVTSWIVSVLCAVGAYHAPSTMGQLCGGSGALAGCLFGTEELISACDACRKHSDARNRIASISERMGWEWQELQ